MVVRPFRIVSRVIRTSMPDQNVMPERNAGESQTHAQGMSGLALTALGIVFGDIGTSPLYTLKTVIDFAGGSLTHDVALGLLSLLIWTLLITVSLKYVTFVMRADNDGEGGILALMSLLRKDKRHQALIAAVGLFGAALIYGDGAITPAISVLSAVEGVKLAAPAVTSFILPVSVFILLSLFAVQHYGTNAHRLGFRPNHGSLVHRDRPSGGLGNRSISGGAAGT